MVKAYPETHQQGLISFEYSAPGPTVVSGDLGIRVAEDGRVWVCIDGVAFLRFRPTEYSGEHGNTKIKT